MTPDVVAPSLQLSQDPRAQRREWEFERAGWIGLGIILLCGLAGLFGDGPIAHATRRAPDGQALVRYDRVVHFGATDRLTVLLPAVANGDTMATVSLDRAFLNVVDVERVSPDPVEVRATGDRVEYHLRRAAAGQPITVEFSVTGDAPGPRLALIGTPSGPVRIRQFVLP